MVVLGHADLIGHSEVTGNLAVQVFFSLSGWLIGGILLKLELRQLPRFFFNRATRIWLPYFSAVSALYLVSAIREPINLRWLEFLFYDLTFVHNWFSLRPSAAIALGEMPLKGTGHSFWSISVEEQFYLVAPLIIVALRFGRSPILWSVIAVTFYALRLTDFLSISLGVTAATVLSQNRNLHLRRACVAGLTTVSLMSLLILTQISYPLGAPFFAISIVLLCARPGNRGPIGLFAGAISFPLYLNHWMGMFLANGIAKHVDWLKQSDIGLVGYALGVVAGAFAYLLVDRNVLAKRDQFYSKAIGIASASAAYALVMLGVVGGFIIFV